MYLFTLPLVLEAPVVLSLWLKNPPDYTVLFTRLALIDALIESVSFPVMSVAQATGKIKLYQSVIGGILLLNLPIAWVVLLLGAPVYSVLIVAIFLTFITFIVRLLIVNHLIHFSLKRFFQKVIAPICIASLLSMILPLIFCYVFDYGFFRLILTVFLSVLSVCLFMYFIGLNNDERSFVNHIILNKLRFSKHTQ
jgi:hypothetical protein